MVEVTRLSILAGASAGDSNAWERFVAVYEPLILGWLRRLNLPRQEASDLCQDVLVIVIKELPRFSHEGRTGSFRAWLRQIAINQARKYWRSGRCRVTTPGGLSFADELDRLEDPTSAQTRLWDEEHDRHVYARLLAVMADGFEPQTVQAFHLMAVNGRTGPEVAAELNMTLAAVYGARARVLRRLRQEAEGLLD